MNTSNLLPTLCDLSREASITSVSDLVHYLVANRKRFRLQLAEAGALLLRGTWVASIDDFEKVLASLTTKLFRYSGDAPRTRLSDFVYTANDVAGHRSISPHNELGYSRSYPELLFFYCRNSADHGGATPLVDGRQVLKLLDQELVSRFRSEDVVYIQNLPSRRDHGVRGAKTWQETFETERRSAVDEMLQERGAAWDWTNGEVLHVEEHVPSVLWNPYSRQEALFCQADRWHASQVEGPDREEIEAIPPDERYHHSRFSRSGDFRETDLTAIRLAKLNSINRFGWLPGDILCIDNVNVLHGRDTFTGRREVFVAMGAF
jgi:alpha-ketoglutarate-dependent taurine dioxygenase